MKSVIADSLVKTYDKAKVRALDGLSLDVEEGTVLSVLGPNRAGKTPWEHKSDPSHVVP